MSIAYGFIRMILTPVPFGTNNDYPLITHFIALIHWLTLPFIVYGFFILWRTKKFMSRFFVILPVLFCLSYSVEPDLQTPRKRVQLVPFLVVALHIGLSNTLNKKIGPKH